MAGDRTSLFLLCKLRQPHLREKLHAELKAGTLLPTILPWLKSGGGDSPTCANIDSVNGFRFSRDLPRI
jgi:hypothetical protein